MENINPKISLLHFLIIIIIFPFLSIKAQQTYTYTPESFEDTAWSAYGNINAKTGSWNTASGNIRSETVTAQDGKFSLVIQNKSGVSVTLPRLSKGAGILTFFAQKTSSSRTFSVLTSSDGTTFNIFGSVITLPAVNVWAQQTIPINDTSVKYIRITVNSNGSCYIDNLLVTPAGAPGITVSTNPVTEITQSSALAGGSIKADSTIKINTFGVCYSTKNTPDTASGKVLASGTANSFSCRITGLSPLTKYFVRAFASTSSGVTYGEEVSFSTLSSDLPVAYWTENFNDTSHIPLTNPAAQVEINITGQGIWKFLGSYKGTNASYICDASPIDLRITKNGSYVITPTLEDGVSSLTFYEGRGDRDLKIYKSADNGTTWILVNTITTNKCEKQVINVNDAAANRIKIANESGSDADVDNISVTVVASGIAPTVTTKIPVTNIGKNSASGGGEVTAQGTKIVRERGVCWSKLPQPIAYDARTIDGTGTGIFASTITGLESGTKYYLRAYALSRSGIGYGAETSFTTLTATLPILSTIAATSVTATSALSGGIVSDNGGALITACGVCWNTSGNPDVSANKTSDSLISSKFTSKIEYLTPKTKYYIRAYATSYAGTSYGAIDSLITGTAAAPTVKTSAVTAIRSMSATAGGEIINSGNATILLKGFCWNKTGNPTLFDSKTLETTNNIIFTHSLPGLLPSTKYYVRAYATNIAGTAFGDEVSFTTSTRLIVYLSPAGNDTTGDGTKNKPYFSLQKAVNLMTPGDSICMAGGVYNYSSRVNIDINGAYGTYTKIASAKGERAILDFSSLSVSSSNQGIRITGSYWHIYGIDIKGAGDNGMLIERDKPSGGNYNDVKDKAEQAHDNIIELCRFYENRDAGIQLKNLAAYNKIINCDSYFNRDAGDGNADGFAPKLTVGTGNYFYGCRAWQNSDDGFDLYLKCTEEGFPQDMLTTIENSWCFMNGFVKDGSEGKGNGNGFKLGGSSDKDQRHDVILRRCLSFDNLQKGFDQNNNVGSMTLINCTGFAKPYLANSSHYTYRIDGTILAPGKKLIHVNNVAVWDGVTDDKKSKWALCEMIGGEKTTCDYLTSETDYITIDTTGARGPRKADGSLPDIDFMHIKPGNTKLIDKGTIMPSIIYAGTAPDLGAFETGIINDVKHDNFLTDFILNQNYPNPFNPVTIISYSLPASAYVTLEIYNMLGQKITTLVNQEKTAGSYQVVFNAGNFSSGLYFYKLSAGAFSETKKMILLK